MDERRIEKKQYGLSRFVKSFKYACAGLIYSFRYEQNMLAHILVTIAVIVSGIFFELQVMEWIMIFIVIGLVLSLELINTALEAVVDLACPEIHPLARVAKDTASAAVFVLALTAIVAGGLIFLPHLLELL